MTDTIPRWMWTLSRLALATPRSECPACHTRLPMTEEEPLKPALVRRCPAQGCGWFRRMWLDAPEDEHTVTIRVSEPRLDGALAGPVASIQRRLDEGLSQMLTWSE